MKVNGETVVFGKTKCQWKTGHSYSGGSYDYHEVLQRWELPKLELYGWVDNTQSLERIQIDIQREVNFDLENRERVKQGLPRLGRCCL